MPLKPHEFDVLLSKLELYFPSLNLFWKVKFAIKSIYLAGDIEVFCPDYTNVVTLFMHEQQKKLDLSLVADC